MIAFACAENMVMMICWTFLAHSFGHWWIALFAILFITTRIRWNKDEKEE